jgi:type IV secretion system protein VirD4
MFLKEATIGTGSDDDSSVRLEAQKFYARASVAIIRQALSPDFSSQSIESRSHMESKYLDEGSCATAIRSQKPDSPNVTSELNNTNQVGSRTSARGNQDHSCDLLLGWQLVGPTDRVRRKWHSVNKRIVEHSLSNAVRYSGDGHCITFAPTGSGKGVGVIIPNLLSYAGPVVVIDPKGENFAVTARYRKDVLKQRILLLDPFHVVADELLDNLSLKRERLNPLDLYLLADSAIDNDSQMLAQILAGGGVSSGDPFWDISGTRLLAGAIAAEMSVAIEEGRTPSMRAIARLLYNDDVVYNFVTMLDGGKIGRFAHQCLASFVSLTDVTRSGVLAMAQSYLSVIMTESIQTHLNDSTIDIRDVVGGEPYTLYIVIPPNKLLSHAVVLQTWVSVLMHAIMERRSVPPMRTLFMLDECANLGSLDTLRKAVTLLRGFGLQVWMFFQDLSQLRALYGEDSKTMINNCGVLQSFGVSRRSAAEDVCRIIGGFKPESVTGMLPTQQLLSVAPAPPTFATLMRYYSNAAFAGRFDSNPLIRPRQIVSPVKAAPAASRRFRFN